MRPITLRSVWTIQRRISVKSHCDTTKSFFSLTIFLQLFREPSAIKQINRLIVAVMPIRSGMAGPRKKERLLSLISPWKGYNLTVTFLMHVAIFNSKPTFLLLNLWVRFNQIDSRNFFINIYMAVKRRNTFTGTDKINAN